jgi:hypothetical protein
VATGDVTSVDGVRCVTLPDGDELRVRPVRPTDAAALARLYEGLDPDDRYTRFFSAYRPTPEFIERETTVAARGGFGLVAVVASPGGREQVVGAAGYTLLPDGDGELAITVADRWRGWLGPYLLDALLSAAARRGIPNLEADVLVTNGPMLALARTRGCVTLDRPDWSVVRVLIGTGPAGPSWPPGDDRRKVLVEGPAGPWHPEAAREARLSVIACPGPATRRGGCPALGGQLCPLAAGADVIVLHRPGPAAPWPDLVDAHRRLHPAVPVCIETRGQPGPGGLPDVPAGEEAAAVAFVANLAGGTR